MRKNSFARGSELLGTIRADAEGLRLTIYSRKQGNAVAVVVGSERYLLTALATLGLAPPVLSFAEYRDGPRISFCRSKPANRASQNFR